MSKDKKIYNDKTQDAVERLKEAAKKVSEEKYEEKPDVRDIIKDFLFFFVSVAIGFAWMLLMLLIISFISLGYIHMKIDKMIIVSIICAVVVGIYYIYKMVVKYKKQS
ncbi:MAG: hypothetical protein J6N21_16995 [Butyrivibrio sp.]|nr:hypothetical protein [Butyrivibrio sp.]MBQ9590579.1 hypothetical protein [Butyrivibrio sp.]